MCVDAAQASDLSSESSAFPFLKQKHADRFRAHLSAPRFDLKGHYEFSDSTLSFFLVVD
jgi:hypothetical protein